MFSCICKKHSVYERTREPIKDIEKVLQDYAWEQYCKTVKCYKKICLQRKKFLVVVPINDIHIENYQEADANPPDTVSRPPQTETMRKEKKERIRFVSKIDTVMEFVNDTESDQTYSFKLDNSRKSSLKVTVQEGFSFGAKTNFTIGLPNMVSPSNVDLGMDKRLTVTELSEIIMEETIFLGTNSNILVKKGSRCIASLIIEEAQVSCNFKELIKLSMPSDGAPCYIRRKKDNSIVHVDKVPPLGDILHETEVVDGWSGKYEVVIRTKGRVQGVWYSRHQIRLETHKLDEKKQEQEEGKKEEGEQAKKEEVVEGARGAAKEKDGSEEASKEEKENNKRGQDKTLGLEGNIFDFTTDA